VDLQDVLFSSQISTERKIAFVELIDRLSIADPLLPVLVPSASNDDVNGSQHARDGGTDFTYRDATLEDAQTATTAGRYEYFAVYGDGYTGHYYQGSGSKFEALVLDPPAYAADFQF
jgi:hypothetical protein